MPDHEQERIRLQPQLSKHILNSLQRDDPRVHAHIVLLLHFLGTPHKVQKHVVTRPNQIEENRAPKHLIKEFPDLHLEDFFRWILEPLLLFRQMLLFFHGDPADVPHHCHWNGVDRQTGDVIEFVEHQGISHRFDRYRQQA